MAKYTETKSYKLKHSTNFIYINLIQGYHYLSCLKRIKVYKQNDALK